MNSNDSFYFCTTVIVHVFLYMCKVLNRNQDPQVCWEVLCIPGNLCISLWKTRFNSYWKRLWILNSVPPSLFCGLSFLIYLSSHPCPQEKVVLLITSSSVVKDAVLNFQKLKKKKKSEIQNLIIIFFRMNTIEEASEIMNEDVLESSVDGFSYGFYWNCNRQNYQPL